MLLVPSSPLTLTQKEEVALIEILARSIERACGSFSVINRTKGGGAGGGGGKILTAKEKRVMESDKHTMATAMIPVLAQLMAKV